MTFYAVLKQDQRDIVINIDQVNGNNRHKLHFHCVECEQRLFAVLNVTNRLPHFRHKDKTKCIQAQSTAHLEIKNYITQLALAQNKTVEQERRFEHAGDVFRADVFIQDGKEIICEVQTSPIQPRTVAARNNFYYTLGIAVNWMWNLSTVFTDGYSAIYEVVPIKLDDGTYIYGKVAVPIGKEQPFLLRKNNKLFRAILDTYGYMLATDPEGFFYVIRRTGSGDLTVITRIEHDKLIPLLFNAKPVYMYYEPRRTSSPRERQKEQEHPNRRPKGATDIEKMQYELARRIEQMELEQADPIDIITIIQQAQQQIEDMRQMEREREQERQRQEQERKERARKEAERREAIRREFEQTRKELGITQIPKETETKWQQPAEREWQVAKWENKIAELARQGQEAREAAEREWQREAAEKKRKELEKEEEQHQVDEEEINKENERLARIYEEAQRKREAEQAEREREQQEVIAQELLKDIRHLYKLEVMAVNIELNHKFKPKWAPLLQVYGDAIKHLEQEAKQARDGLVKLREKGESLLNAAQFWDDYHTNLNDHFKSKWEPRLQAYSNDINRLEQEAEQTRESMDMLGDQLKNQAEEITRLERERQDRIKEAWQRRPAPQPRPKRKIATRQQQRQEWARMVQEQQHRAAGDGE